MPQPLHRAILALASAVAFIGFAYIAIMPPFEGFDENAHYARIIATAYTDQAPFANVPTSRLTAEVDDYQKRAPMPEEWLMIPVPTAAAESHVTPDYDNFIVTKRNPVAERYKAQSYASFFADPARVKAYVADFRGKPGVAGYQPGKEPNWEYQHPPLYYYLFAPFARLTSGLALTDKIIVLRLLNYLLVLGALIISLRAMLGYMPDVPKPAAVEVAAFGLLVPFLSPCFWGEFGRLGNDNLCAFLFAIAMALLFKNLSVKKPETKDWLLLGLVLGLGWLAKFTMVMVSGGMILFLLLRQANAKKQKFMSVVWTGLVAVIIGGSWYIYNHFVLKAPGSLEITWMLNDKNFLENFKSHMSFAFYLKGVHMMLLSGVYLSNFLSKDLNDTISGILYVLAVIVAVAFALVLRRKHISQIAWLPVWVTVPALAMLLVHIAYSIIELNSFITAGRYLFVVFPAFLLAAGLGLREMARAKKPEWKAIVYAVLIAAPIVNLILFWRAMAIFGGCAQETRMLSGEFDFGPHYCLDKFGPTMTNVGVLAWPVMGLVCFVMGWVFLVYGEWKLHRYMAKA